MTKRHRLASRALILDPDNRFLLFLSHFAPGSGLDPRWVFPGGGIEPGETPMGCIIREIYEETGLRAALDDIEDLGYVITHEMEDKRIHDTGEAFFFQLHVNEQFEPSKEFWTEYEHRDTVAHHWWSIDEVIEQKPWIGPDGAIEFLIERFGIQP